MKIYRIVVSCGACEREYTSHSRNALKHAYGLGSGGDTITVYDGDTPISRAEWDVSRCEYTRRTV